MSAQDEKVQQAMAAFKAGRKQEARTLLLSVVDENESHEAAWLYLSAMVDTLEEQQICLENVLAINPANEKARKGLESLSQKRAAQQNGTPPAASAVFSSPFPSFETPSGPAPASRPPAKTPPIGAEFATTSGDTLVNGAPNPASFDSGFDFQAPFSGSSDDSLDWLTGGSPLPDAFPTPPTPSTPAAPAAPPAPSQPDSFGIPTSVDWSRADGQAAYGSGKQVELPSAQEYDEWVQNLNLSNNAPASPASPPAAAAPSSDTGTSAPFGDTSFMMDSSPFVMEDDPAAPNAFSSDVFGSAWDTDDDFGSAGFAAPDPFASSSAPEQTEGVDSPFGDLDAPMLEEEQSAPYVPLSEEDDLSFSLDDQPGKNDFGSIWSDDFEEVPPPTAPAPAVAVAASRPAPAASTVTREDYFRYIPDEIEAKSGRIKLGSLALLAGMVMLIVLNVVSFAMLLL